MSLPWWSIQQQQQQQQLLLTPYTYYASFLTKRKWKTSDFFQSFKITKWQPPAVLYFLLACVASVSVWFQGAERDFRFFFVLCSETAPKRLLRRLHFLFSPVILTCARVLLWRLAIALIQMLPAGEVYFTPVMSSKPPSKPRVELIFYSGLQFVGFSSSSFTKSAEFVSLPGKASLVSISGAVLFL